MGPSHKNPFQEGGEVLSQYVVNQASRETSLTYLTHKRTHKQYLLR